ncbi:MAG: hypothetical protein K2H41_00825 [Acetatifactor sp.]|nr:hypothetical protein [Acetatifactor sp.]MDE7113662.1 hypothetical protein [Acetatifactor sp.]
MRVDFIFDKELVEASDYTMEDIYETIKREFEAKNLPCVSDGEVLSFADRGHKDDFSHIWVNIVRISRTEWFLDLATSCKFYEDDGKWEDVLAQARKKYAKRT